MAHKSKPNFPSIRQRQTAFSDNDGYLLTKGLKGGFKSKPPNSPDLNVIDLDFLKFDSIAP